jgi:hypothetical protein
VLAAVMRVAGILAALAAAWSAWVFSQHLDTFALAALARTYHPARFTAERVVTGVGARWVEGRIDDQPETLDIADPVFTTGASGEPAAGRTYAVLYNADVPAVGFSGHGLRVIPYAPGFAETQRRRLTSVVLTGYGPVLALLAVTIACGRAAGRSLRPWVTAPGVLLGFQAAAAAFLAVATAVQSPRLARESAPAWFIAVMRVLGPVGSGTGLLTLFIALILFTLWRRRRRRRALAREAAALGLSFAPSGTLSEELGVFALFHGQSGSVDNRMEGEHGGAHVVVFDFEYMLHGGGISRQTVVLWPEAGSGSAVQLAPPETTADYAFAASGTLEVSVAGSPRFSSLYHLRASDPAAASAVLTAPVLDFLAERPGWTVDARERMVLVYREGKTVPPRDLRAFLEHADEIRRAVRGWS